MENYLKMISLKRKEKCWFPLKASWPSSTIPLWQFKKWQLKKTLWICKGEMLSMLAILQPFQQNTVGHRMLNLYEQNLRIGTRKQ